MFVTETTAVLFWLITSRGLPALNASIAASLDPMETLAYLLFSGNIRTVCFNLYAESKVVTNLIPEKNAQANNARRCSTVVLTNLELSFSSKKINDVYGWKHMVPTGQH